MKYIIIMFILQVILTSLGACPQQKVDSNVIQLE